jgi:ubiquitin-associated SH3 domain-containing protein
VPERRAGPEGFARDCPLTVVGSLQSSLLGQAMKEAGVAIHHVFCSPRQSTIQTIYFSGITISQSKFDNL